MAQRSLELDSPVIAGDEIKSYVGVPLLVGAEVKGVVSLQNVDRENAFSDSDVRLLETLASSMSVALENARLFDETTQHAAELSIINSVQQGLASKLNVQAIFDLVGEKIREIFDAQVVDIITYDRTTNLCTWRFSLEKGVRDYPEPRPPLGFSGRILRTRQALMINQDLMQRAQEVGSSVMAGAASKSYLGVPLVIGDEAKGVISLQNVDREHAFSDSDLRLLTTLASSMSVALENARLFDETTQRAAELTLINSVQQGLASKLDVQAIFDLVGDKIRDLFDAQVVVISTYDRVTDMRHDRYVIERGQRFYLDPRPVDVDGGGFGAHVVQTHQPILINRNAAERAKEFGSSSIPAGEEARSVLYVPLLVGNEVRGLISLQNLDREDAFADSDLRLLTTLANSMSVALENARLFDETNRLLNETNQRAAELAIINSVQSGLASKLDMQAIYELVGEKVREVFHSDTTYICSYNAQTQSVFSHYYMEKSHRLAPQPLPFGSGIYSHVIRTRQPVITRTSQEGDRLGATHVQSPDSTDDLNQSSLYVPIMLADKVTGVVSIQSHQQNAYTESDMHLLTTLANSMSVALENARLFDETQRLLKETDQRAAELSIINSVQEGLASKLEVQAVYDLVGDKIRDLFDAQVVLIASYDQAQGTTQPRYVIEKGERFYPQPGPLSDTAKLLIRTRQPLLINDNWAQRMAELGIEVNLNSLVPGTDFPQSVLFTPLIVGNEVKGVISLQNVDRE
ncbi:MAG TPA: GAF domain-containing protein, partial [Anaerolineae bacterium]|nr:GAF domain-containing protein [Anaerolineae bacterium]